MATCPECEFDDIDLEDLEEGDTISCPECGTLLVMTGADELDFADEDEDDVEADEDDEHEEGEDYDDEDESEDEGEDEDWEE